MKISQAGIFVLIAITILTGTSCNRVIARKDLVDGAEAYKDKKFDKAEALFRDAIARDPEQKTAQLFLARTLHSEYAADREKTDKADAAIAEYKKTIEEYKNTVDASKNVLAGDRSPCSYSAYEIRSLEGDKKAALDAFGVLRDSYGAISNILDSMQKPEERVKWLEQWGADEKLPGCLRASAYNSLASKENTCANDITEAPDVKKTVTKDGKPVFEFKKPEKPEDYENLKSCVQRGTELVDKSLALDQSNDSIWSYKMSFLNQNMRLAEMDNRIPDRDRLKGEYEQAKAKFTELAKQKKEKSDAEEAAVKADEEEKQNTK